MVNHTGMVNGHVIIEGVKFLWWLTDGHPPRLTVSQTVYGTRTEVVAPKPAQQAKDLARSMFADALAAKAARRRQ